MSFREKIYLVVTELNQPFGTMDLSLIHIYDWAPPAGGNVELIKVLNFLRSCREMNIDEANRSVIALSLIHISSAVSRAASR